MTAAHTLSGTHAAFLITYNPSALHSWRRRALPPPAHQRPPAQQAQRNHSASSRSWRCVAPPVAAAPATVSFVSYDGSSFALEYNAPGTEKPVRLLVDPWLADDLVFLDQPWFYRSSKALTRKPLAEFGAFDAILLTQHLPDHAHPPTLRLLPRGLPVVAPTCAQELLRSLGYKNVTTLSPHESATPLPTLLPGFTVTAGPGAIVGPPWSKPQLSYVFEFANPTQPEPDGAAAASDATAVPSSSLSSIHSPLRIYFETHGMHDAGFLRKITDGGRIALDAVIGPVRGTRLPLPFAKGYTIVNGAAELLEACRVTRPQACVPFDNTRTAGSGLLSMFIDQSTGGYEELAAAVCADPQLRDMKICVPKLMEPVVIAPSSAVHSPLPEANEVVSSPV